MSADSGNDDSLYPIAVLIDELRNEDVQVWHHMLNVNSALSHFYQPFYYNQILSRKLS